MALLSRLVSSFSFFLLLPLLSFSRLSASFLGKKVLLEGYTGNSGHRYAHRSHDIYDHLSLTARVTRSVHRTTAERTVTTAATDSLANYCTVCSYRPPAVHLSYHLQHTRFLASSSSCRAAVDLDDVRTVIWVGYRARRLPFHVFRRAKDRVQLRRSFADITRTNDEQC